MIDQENRGLRVVGEAASGDEALQVRRRLDVDVVVLDHRMPGLTGLEHATALLAEPPYLPILLYSALTDTPQAAEARSIGLQESVSKGEAPRIQRLLPATL